MEEKMLQCNDDASLVKQTLDGNKQAFDSLVVKYNASIYKLILSWVKSHEDARDITQEVFINAYKELFSLREPEKFYHWLRQIAIHRCQNWKRGNYIVLFPLDESVISEEQSPDESIILNETLSKIMEAIDRLPEIDKSLVKERYLEGSSYNTLSEKYGVSPRALAVRLLRIKQRIRIQLKGLLAMFPVLPYRKFIKKFIKGSAFEKGIAIGVIESMKAAIVKDLIIWGTLSALVLGGSGFLLWEHYQKPIRIAGKQGTLEILSVENSSAKGQKSLSGTDNLSRQDSDKSVNKVGSNKIRPLAKVGKGSTVEISKKGNMQNRLAEEAKNISSLEDESLPEITPVPDDELDFDELEKSLRDAERSAKMIDELEELMQGQISSLRRCFSKTAFSMNSFKEQKNMALMFP